MLSMTTCMRVNGSSDSNWAAAASRTSRWSRDDLDGPNVVRGNTENGLWQRLLSEHDHVGYPAALAGGDISAPLQKGTLVDRSFRHPGEMRK